MAGKTVYVQDPETGKFVEKQTYLSQQHAIHVMKPFKSPIDGTIIHDPAQLRAHHRKHGTTDSRDYSPEFREKASRARDLRLQGLDPKSKQDRLNVLKRATEHVRT